MAVLVAVGRSLRQLARDASPAQRLAYAVGTVLIGVGFLHLLGYVVLGGPWVGPVAWRKPFAFGVSFGLTTVTLAWLSGYQRLGRRLQWCLLAPLAAANSSEVAWVSVQRARGVASHFNFDTTFDTALFIANGAAIAVTVAVILVLTIRSFKPIDGPAGMTVAMRAGLVCLVVAQIAGGLMIYQGINAAEAGAAQLTTWGGAGIMKVPHAVGMHSIQALPGLAWLLGFSTFGVARRRRTVLVASGGYAGLVAVSVIQTLAGLAPWDLTLITGALLVVSLVGFGGAAVAAVASLRGARPALT
ncbi:MAG: hypothetical protein H0T98_08675 [Euzebyaceae bacterium]|jgi:hypothetical protein|nr:hypothetical protein [Euzebyaceae bacterium]